MSKSYINQNDAARSFNFNKYFGFKWIKDKNITSKEMEKLMAEYFQKNMCFSYTYFKNSSRALKSGLDPNSSDKNGSTRLMFFAKYGANIMIALYVKYGADLNAADNMGRTPLMYATRYAQADTVKFLLKLGADAHQRDNEGRTAFDIVDEILRNEDLKFQPCTPDKVKKTALNEIKNVLKKSQVIPLCISKNNIQKDKNNFSIQRG